VRHTPNDNRRPGWQARHGGKYDISSAGNLLKFPAQDNNASPFDELTAELILAKFRDGTLPEGVLIAFMQTAGVPV
jgi:hypothetical protein